MSDEQFKRDHNRFFAGLPCTLHTAKGEFEASAFDISRRGVSVSGCLPSPSDTMIRIEVTSLAGDLRLDARARVAHIRDSEDEEEGAIRIGLQFDELDDDQRKTIDALVSRVVEGMAPAALDGLSEDSPAREIRAALEKVPLAHRITLAVRAQKAERRMLRHDASPLVIENLARNPTGNILELRQLLRNVRLTPRTLDVIAADPRWRGDEEVQISVATHPSVTLSTARRIVSSLSPQGVKRAIQRPGLHPVLKTQLMSRTTERSRRGW